MIKSLAIRISTVKAEDTVFLRKEKAEKLTEATYDASV